jgi:hypothetical protein
MRMTAMEAASAERMSNAKNTAMVMGNQMFWASTVGCLYVDSMCFTCCSRSATQHMQLVRVLLFNMSIYLSSSARAAGLGVVQSVYLYILISTCSWSGCRCSICLSIYPHQHMQPVWVPLFNLSIYLSSSACAAGSGAVVQSVYLSILISTCSWSGCRCSICQSIYPHQHMQLVRVPLFNLSILINTDPAPLFALWPLPLCDRQRKPPSCLSSIRGAQHPEPYI